MKALVFEEYGGPDRLRLRDLATPTPTGDQVLVRILATSLNRSDWEMLHGSPAYTRMNGFRRPRHQILGSDMAGEVVELGPEATQFAVGDLVYGDLLEHLGCLAEYVVTRESKLAAIPEGISAEVAACLPQAGMIALRGITARGMSAGQHVLINGAGGGSGMLAIQLAKREGLEVTAVDNAEKLDFMTSMGADHVIDYRKQDYTRGPLKYDLVLDLVAHRPPWRYQRALAPGGRFYAVGGPVKVLLGLLAWSPVARLTGRRVGILVVQQGVAGLGSLIELVQSGEVKVVIDRSFSLSQSVEAMTCLGEGHARGKVVVIPEPDPSR